MGDIPVDGSPPPAGTQAYTRTPQQALNFTRLISVALTGVVPLFTYVLWVLFADERASGATPGQLKPIWMVLLAIGLVAAAGSSFVARAVGRSVSRRWAESGLRAEDVATPGPAPTSTFLGIDIGPNASAMPMTLWDRFSTFSVVGSAMPEALLLIAFVVTFMTYLWPVMIGSVVVYFVFWGVNFPRRSQWDEWASFAGLTLPWDEAAGSASASAIPPDSPTTPR